MVDNNNPAGRLYNLLKKVTKKDKGKIGYIVWRDLLNTNDNQILFHNLEQIAGLPRVIKEQIKLRGNNYETLLKSLTEIENAFSTLVYLNNPFEVFIGKIDKSMFLTLEVCSEILSSQCPQEHIDSGELSNLRDDIQKLITEILDSDIKESLKKFMVRHLRAIDSAIQDYMISGIEPLEREFEAIIGAAKLYFDPDICENMNNTKQGNKFWEIVGRIATFIGIASGTLKISESVIKFLPILK